MRSVRAICVFCASSKAVDGGYHEAATDLGRRIGRLGIELVYGGAGIGLMGAVARGVHEEGGRVTGVIPEFFRKKEKEISTQTRTNWLSPVTCVSVRRSWTNGPMPSSRSPVGSVLWKRLWRSCR